MKSLFKNSKQKKTTNNKQYTPCLSSAKEIHSTSDVMTDFIRFIRLKIHVVYAQKEHKHNCQDKHARASHITP